MLFCKVFFCKYEVSGWLQDSFRRLKKILYCHIPSCSVQRREICSLHLIHPWGAEGSHCAAPGDQLQLQVPRSRAPTGELTWEKMFGCDSCVSCASVLICAAVFTSTWRNLMHINCHEKWLLKCIFFHSSRYTVTTCGGWRGGHLSTPWTFFGGTTGYTDSILMWVLSNGCDPVHSQHWWRTAATDVLLLSLCSGSCIQGVTVAFTLHSILQFRSHS